MVFSVTFLGGLSDALLDLDPDLSHRVFPDFLGVDPFFGVDFGVA